MGEKGYNAAMKFSRLLSIHATTLGNVCPNLRQLTLRAAYDCKVFWRPPGAVYWETLDPLHLCKWKDEKKIDWVIQTIVEKLPNLQQLMLGKFKKAKTLERNGDNEDREDWGKARRWETFVAKTVPRPTCDNTYKNGYSCTIVHNLHYRMSIPT